MTPSTARTRSQRRRIRWCCASFLLTLCLVSNRASASFEDDVFAMSLEELLQVKVSTASKLPRAEKDSAAIISVYSAEEIALFGGRDLAEVLRRITGVNPILDALNGRYRMSMRHDAPGINNNHVLILLDGIPINRESYAGGLWVQANLSAIPLEIIKQIEVVRGPGAVLYGTNAYAGVINLITFSGEELDSRLRLGGGNNDAIAAGATYGYHHDDNDVAIALRHYASDGSPVTARSAGNVIDESLSERSPGALLTARRGDFHASLWAGRGESAAIRGTPGMLYQGRVRNDRVFANVGYESLLTEQWTMKLDLSHVSGRTRLEDPALPFGKASYKSDDSRVELQMQADVNDHFSLVLGTTVDYLSVRVADPQTFLPFWDNTLYGAYAQAEYLLGNTRFIGGAQFNKSESIPDRTVPRVGLIHHFTEHFGAKLMYAEAFRAPYALEADTDISTPLPAIRGNPDLDHEEVATVDAQLFYNRPHLQTALTWFRSTQDDLIFRTQTSAGPPLEITFLNVGELTIEGLELESKWIPSRRWFLSFSATTQRNEGANGIEDFTLEPDVVVKAGIGYKASRWSAGLFDVYRDAYQDNVVVLPTRQVLNPESRSLHYLTFNATWTLPALDHLTLGLYVDNVTDREIYIPPVPGFTVSNINTMPSIESGRTFLVSASLPLD